jgi:hypothetical protein
LKAFSSICFLSFKLSVMTNGIGSTLGSTFNVGAFSKRQPPDVDLEAQVSSIYKDNFCTY